MSDWISALRDDARRSFGDKPMTATLATVRATAGRAEAAARTVVVRDLAIDGRLTIASDARSDKHGELIEVPGATVVFWLAECRRQYRIAGPVDVIGGDQPSRAAIWRAMSDSARALFAWPMPGADRAADGEFARAVSADAEMPANFELLVMTPRRVDVLDLRPHPHQRTIWAFVDGRWDGRVVNP